MAPEVTVACIFLNKRFNTSKHRERFASWLNARSISIVFAQDPWPTAPEGSAFFADFAPIGGNRFVFAWAKAGFQPAHSDLLEEYCQRIDLGYIAVYNVYVNAYSSEQRTAQLERIRHHIHSSGDENLLIVGAFNIAPEPGDGLIGGKISHFNDHKDRGALHNLIQSCALTDLGRKVGSSEWTLERVRSIGKIQFRCDLALISIGMGHNTTFGTDHTTRRGQKAFTDHSGLLITLQASL